VSYGLAVLTYNPDAVREPHYTGLLETAPQLVGSAEEFPLSVGDVAMRELNVTGIFRYTNTWPTGIRMVASGLVQLDPLVTDEFGLDEVVAALAGPATARSLKRVVRPQHRRLND
jgi:L-iditol 2-dehydrogenase